jgi:hypothetical protein
MFKLSTAMDMIDTILGKSVYDRHAKLVARFGKAIK